MRCASALAEAIELAAIQQDDGHNVARPHDVLAEPAAEDGRHGIGCESTSSTRHPKSAMRRSRLCSSSRHATTISARACSRLRLQRQGRRRARDLDDKIGTLIRRERAASSPRRAQAAHAAR